MNEFLCLDKNAIFDQLTLISKPFFPVIDQFNVIPSTNDYLLQHLSQGLRPGTVCIAEGQTAGRGRMGKTWVSPTRANIYCSFYYRFEGSPQALSGLSLVVGLGILEGLKSIGELPRGLGLKWPNDIWYQNAKLAGILIETVAQPPNAGGRFITDVIIGIGLNVHMKSETGPDYAWTDLTQIMGFTPSRNRVIAALLNVLSVYLTRFQHAGLSPFLPLWQQYDLLMNQSVQLLKPQGKMTGIARGINERGELCVEGEEGLIAVNTGEVSVLMSTQ